MSEEIRTPDAVRIPRNGGGGFGGGGIDAMLRGRAILNRADIIIGVAPGTAERSHGRTCDDGYHFVTKSPADTLFFPSAHARSGQSRYRWDEQPDGVLHGFLVDDEARAACDPVTLRKSFEMARRDAQ